MTLTRDVVLPPTSTVGGGILTQARPLPTGWERGITTAATGACLAAGEHIACTTSPTEKDFQNVGDFEFESYLIELSVQCSPLGGARANEERQARAFQLLDAKSEYSVGFVLATGTTQALVDTGNTALVDAVASGSAATAEAALALIEDLIAVNLQGLLAWVHVTPARLTQLVDAGVVYRDDMGTWRTPTGHVVVASPGYAGNIDDVIVATNEVFASVGDISRSETVDRSDNRYMSAHEAPALAIFDPCFNVSVAIDTSP